MSHPILFVIAMGIFGYLAPEILAAFGKCKVPTMFNILSSIAAMLATYAIVG
jgi:hypothetical protein